MAFISSSIVPVNATSLKLTKTCAVNGARVNYRAPVRRSVVVSTPTMADSKYPDSSVLGLGKDVPSSLYIIASALALPLGCYSVYMSNIVNPLSAELVNPQFIVGSLLVPISWGL